MATRKTVVGRIDPEVLTFTAGKDTELDRVLVEADCIGSAAHVTMLSRMPVKPRLFSTAEKDAVITELVAIMRSSRKGEFEIRSEDQDVHLAVERVLTSKLGEPGKRIHTGRSRNDQVALDLRLFAREQLCDVIEAVAQLARSLLRQAKGHRRVPMVGRTHLQPGMPSSVGLWASAHAEGLLDDIVLLKAAYELNDRCPLGSAAGYGVPLPIDRALTARLLGFSAPHHNVLYASNSRGKGEAVILSALAQVMLTLSRLSEDLILYSMPEFGYFTLPAAFCTGSSIMPQKNNPDVLELIRARAARVQGDAVTAAGILKALPGGYNRDLQEMKEPFMNGLAMTGAALRVLNRLVADTQVNRDALLAGFTPEVYAADRALELVGEGMSFRDAYHHVREHLDELESRNPDEAVARKTHLGAPAGLDFSAMNTRANDEFKFANKERRRYHSRVCTLLGVSYPDLETRK